ncbi:MAG: hypothetical protein JW697_08725 [Kosmotogaceae bacterium]|nr:hypothetical protein [Kosmotogaceae bacterium]
MRRSLTVCFLALAIGLFARFEIPLPVFSMPQSDSKNGIAEVFTDFSEEDLTLQVTVVFIDEDYPCLIIDFLYDVYRYFRYGRIEDIETFYIMFDSDGKITAIDFPGVFASDHAFDDTKNLHGSAVLMPNLITFVDERPLIFVNTWNHMFGVIPSFDRTNEMMLSNYLVTEGTRWDAEHEYSWHY